MKFWVWVRGLVFGPMAFVGWALILLQAVPRLVGWAGDMEFIMSHLGEVGRFLETGWGMAAVMTLGVLFIAYSGHRALMSKKTDQDTVSVQPSNLEGSEAKREILPKIHRARSFRHTVRYVIARRWPADEDKALGGLLTMLNDACTALRQEAINGSITVWGNKSSDNVLIPIAREYWMSNPISLSREMGFGRINETIITMMREKIQDDHFYNLVFDEAEIEAIWPKRQEHTEIQA